MGHLEVFSISPPCRGLEWSVRRGVALQPLHQVLVEVAQRLDDIYSARPSELDGDLAALQALAIDEDR